MVLTPIPQESMQYIRKAVEEVAGEDRVFVAVAVLVTGNSEDGRPPLALSVLGDERLPAEAIESYFQHAFADTPEEPMERGETGDVPMFAVGNSEPLPDHLPGELKEILRKSRRKAGWCDHGNKLGICMMGCR